MGLLWVVWLYVMSTSLVGMHTSDDDRSIGPSGGPMVRWRSVVMADFTDQSLTGQLLASQSALAVFYFISDKSHDPSALIFRV